MQKNFLSSKVPAFKRSGTIDFDTEKFKPTSDSVKIYEELNAISEEIEDCRRRNAR